MVDSSEPKKEQTAAQQFAEGQKMPETTSPFDRQVRIPGWNQDKVQEQVCLLLGVGGLGSGVALGLARLGVKKIILLDKDVVDTSNLNRQILFRPDDVGKPKATQGKIRLEEQHKINPDMEVVAYHICALDNWPTIIELTKEATVVFNMIDVGQNFDLAISALCLKNDKLLIMGGTFCQQICVDYFRPEDPCLVCSGGFDKDIVAKLKPSLIETYADLRFVPADVNPVGLSNCYLCMLCAQMMVSRFSTLLLADPEVKVNQRFIMTVNDGDVVQFPVESDPDCTFCKDMIELKVQK